MTMTTTNPYADAYDTYWQAGWRGVLPLPHRAKKWPPTGYTGRDYAEPSYADCATWADLGPRNIALHLPRGVIGIDVDDYAGKGGGTTLHKLVAEHGPLPATWLSTSRGDGISGIRLFRIPDDVELISAMPGIEIVQAHHRYVVCWPSIHPETNAVYQWVNEATGESDVPHIDGIPDLPASWVDALTSTSDPVAKADIDADDVMRFLAGLPSGDPCQHVIAAAGYAMSGKDRHDAYMGAQIGVIDNGRSGCPGAVLTLQRLKASFVAEVTAPGTSGRRTEAEAMLEWSRGMEGAIAKMVTKHPEQGASCPDDYLAELLLNEAEDDHHEDQDEPQDEPDEDGRELLYQKQVARKAGEMKLVEDAKALLARSKAGQAPPLDAVNLGAFLSQPDEAIAYRVDRLWPCNGRVLLAAAAKAGKTTMITNLLGCLADGGAFLGLYDVQPVVGTVVYLNLEVSANQMRRWLRRSGIANTDRIHVVNLRGQMAALTLATEDGRNRVARWLRDLGAEVVILDPLAPLLASLGLDENSNTDVATFFSWWSTVLHDGGVVDDFVAHHAGHHGGRSRGASRLMDEPDALWTITRDAATDEDEDDVYAGMEPRFFKAVGRDVEVAEQPLEFDGATGLLNLGTGNRKQMRAEALVRQAEARVLSKIDGGATVTRDIIKNNGNEKQNSAALEELVGRGVLSRQDLGPGKPTLYRRIKPGVATVATVANESQETVATGGVASLYIGDTPDSTPVSPARTCEDCGDTLTHANVVVCRPCAKKRLAGGGL